MINWKEKKKRKIDLSIYESIEMSIALAEWVHLNPKIVSYDIFKLNEWMY